MSVLLFSVANCLFLATTSVLVASVCLCRLEALVSSAVAYCPSCQLAFPVQLALPGGWCFMLRDSLFGGSCLMARLFRNGNVVDTCGLAEPSG